MIHHLEEDQKTLCWEVDAHVKAQKTLEDEVVELKVTFHDSLQQTIQAMFEVCDRVVE